MNQELITYEDYLLKEYGEEKAKSLITNYRSQRKYGMGNSFRLVLPLNDCERQMISRAGIRR